MPKGRKSKKVNTSSTLDEHFQHFAKALKNAREQFQEVEGTDEWFTYQKDQVEGLVELEDQFRLALIDHRDGDTVYLQFMNYICDERRNILAARPFFRERQEVFTNEISLALKTRNHEALKKFHFNFQFVQFVLKYSWKPYSKVLKLGLKIRKAREELIIMNMPLAISRARIFYSRTPKSHMDYMDFINTCAEGLMSGIDKFVLPFSKVFRSVIIGRCVGNCIESYSETLVHFYPSDKRKIYRANKASGKQSDLSFSDIADKVNFEVEPGRMTNPSEIADLMAASSCVSMDAMALTEDDNHSEGTKTSDRFAAPDSWRPDVRVESEQKEKAYQNALLALSPREKKFLLLKGII